jgi:hypothetical protein
MSEKHLSLEIHKHRRVAALLVSPFSRPLGSMIAFHPPSSLSRFRFSPIGKMIFF